MTRVGGRNLQYLLPKMEFFGFKDVSARWPQAKIRNTSWLKCHFRIRDSLLNENDATCAGCRVPGAGL